MTHALVAVCSSAVTAYMLIPPTGSGGYHVGLAAVAILSGLCAAILEPKK
jgi:hypothetical protein